VIGKNITSPINSTEGASARKCSGTDRPVFNDVSQVQWIRPLYGDVQEVWWVGLA
jgi:hypothetical protein